jgi:uncharacterized protein YerC
MQVSRKKINPQVKKQVYDMLHRVIADLKSPAEVKDFLDSFLGENEQEVISRRLSVAYLLNKGKTYSYIKNSLKISSTTVAAVARDIKKSKGFKIALQKIQADEWADRWAQKITQVFGKGQK